MKIQPLMALLITSLFASKIAMAENQSVTDIKGSCKILAPNNFVVGPVKSVVASPDHSIIATVHGLRANITWEQATAIAKMTVKPLETVEESDGKLVFKFDPIGMPGAAPGSSCKYIVSKAATNICVAQVCVSKAGDQSVGDSILSSLASAS